jgi:carbon monoxide dehydrogenase subunit G
MELTNSARIARPRDQVWNALHDVEILRKCIPGCEMLERLPDGEMTARVVLRIGPVKATFSGKVRFENAVEPRSLTLAGEGSGGIAGHARGAADVSLADDGDGTILSYSAKADVGGKIAQLGARLIQSTSQKLAGEFFSRFEKEVAGFVAT